MFDISNWLGKVFQSFQNTDTTKFYQCIRIDNHKELIPSIKRDSQKFEEELRLQLNGLSSSYTFPVKLELKDLYEFVKPYLYAKHCYFKKNTKEVFRYIRESFQPLKKLFIAQDGIWMLYIMRYYVQLLSKFAIEEGSEATFQEAIITIRSLMSSVNLSKAQPVLSKKRGLVFCAKELCVINFKHHKYNDCKPILSDVNNYLETSGLPIWEFFKSDLVTLKYYSGRVAIIDNNFTKAEKELDLALRQCKNNAEMNQRTIIKYLIPVKIYCGKFPSAELIKRYKAYEYVDMANAIVQGNLKEFQNQVDKMKRLWIKRNLLLFMEKLESVLMRNLFKKVHKLAGGGPIVDTEYFKKALNFGFEKEQYDIEETECIIGNLILQGFMKGYISHDKKKLVLSKTTPFPKFSKLLEDQTLQ